MKKKYTEVIWYGRGGQGAITASQIIAEAAYLEGYLGVTTAPSFGAERRGAPVASFLRLSHEPIRIFSQIADPDIVVVLDPTLLPVLNLNTTFNKQAILVVNSVKSAAELDLGGFDHVGIANVTQIALDSNLTASGVPILNTPILGAFIRVTGLVSLASVETAIRKKFANGRADLNLAAARRTYESTKIYEHGNRVEQ